MDSINRKIENTEILVKWNGKAIKSDTKDLHEWAVLPNQGKHVITAVDTYGNEVKRRIKISQ